MILVVVQCDISKVGRDLGRTNQRYHCKQAKSDFEERKEKALDASWEACAWYWKVMFLFHSGSLLAFPYIIMESRLGWPRDGRFIAPSLKLSKHSSCDLAQAYP